MALIYILSYAGTIIHRHVKNLLAVNFLTYIGIPLTQGFWWSRFHLVLQVGIEEILFAKCRTNTLVNFISKRNVIHMQFRPPCSSIFLFYSQPQLRGQHMAVVSALLYTTNVMRVTYNYSFPILRVKMLSTSADVCYGIT